MAESQIIFKILPELNLRRCKMAQRGEDIMTNFHRIEISVLLSFVALLGINILSPNVRGYWLLVLSLFFLLDAILGTTWREEPEERLLGRLEANISMLLGLSIVSLIVWGLEMIFPPALCLLVYGLDTLGLVAFAALIHSEETSCRKS